MPVPGAVGNAGQPRAPATPGTAAHPAREGRARRWRGAVADTTVTEHRKVRTDWFAQARRDLRITCRYNLTEGIEDRDARVALRSQLQVADRRAIVRVGATRPM